MSRIFNPGKKLDAWDDQLEHDYFEMGWQVPTDLNRWFNLLYPLPGEIFLDIGCGSSDLLAEAVQRGLKSIGIETTPEAAAISLKSAPQAKVVVGDAQEIPFESDYFHLLTCFNLISFFINPLQGMQEIQRVLKPGGRACLLLPNAEFLGLRHPRIQEELKSLGAEIFFPLPVWREMLEAVGLNVRTIFPEPLSAKTSSVLEHYPWSVRFIHRLTSRLFWLWPRKFAYHFIFICQKNPQTTF